MTRPLTTRAARAILLAAWIASFAAVDAQAQELTILRYEPLAELTVAESSNGADIASHTPRGRDFDTSRGRRIR